MEKPVDIYQECLDAITPWLLSGGVQRASQRFALPFQVATNDTARLYRTSDELFELINAYFSHLKSKGATTLYRKAEDARFLNATTIEGFHVTHVLRGETQIVRPYASRLRLRRVADLWCAYESISAVHNTDWRLVAGPPDPVEDRHGTKTSMPGRSLPEPETAKGPST